MQKRMITNENGEILIDGDGGRNGRRNQVLMEGMELNIKDAVLKVIQLTRATGNKAVAQIRLMSKPDGLKVQLRFGAIIVR